MTYNSKAEGFKKAVNGARQVFPGFVQKVKDKPSSMNYIPIRETEELVLI